jgi:hypothetical protein
MLRKYLLLVYAWFKKKKEKELGKWPAEEEISLATDIDIECLTICVPHKCMNSIKYKTLNACTEEVPSIKK